jgi:hypothetical protein
MSETQPGADEKRVAHILRQRGVGPDSQPPAIPRELPPGFERRPRDWLDEILDGNTTPTPAPVRKPPPEPEPEPPVEEPVPPDEPGTWSRAWDAVTARVKPWKAIVALAAAVVPIPWTGYSAAVTWAYTVSEARGIHQGFGYALAFGTFTLAGRRLVNTRSVIALWATAVTFIGLFSAMSWYDPILWLTGVFR